jgi:hypothetical protein
MSTVIKVQTYEDIDFEAALLLAPAANYSDGPTPGFRPAIYFALLEMPANIHASGMFNLKDEDKQETSNEAKIRARTYLFGENCLCQAAINYILETYSSEV